MHQDAGLRVEHSIFVTRGIVAGVAIRLEQDVERQERALSQNAKVFGIGPFQSSAAIGESQAAKHARIADLQPRRQIAIAELKNFVSISRIYLFKSEAPGGVCSKTNERLL